MSILAYHRDRAISLLLTAQDNLADALPKDRGLNKHDTGLLQAAAIQTAQAQVHALLALSRDQR